LVFATTATKVAAGLACGLVLSLVFKGVLSKFAAGSSYNPLAIGAVILLLAATSALAAFIPARRASSVEPMDALRYE
jgi:putative ABC transport system permease protein